MREAALTGFSVGQEDGRIKNTIRSASDLALPKSCRLILMACHVFSTTPLAPHPPRSFHAVASLVGAFDSGAAERSLPGEAPGDPASANQATLINHRALASLANCRLGPDDWTVGPDLWEYEV